MADRYDLNSIMNAAIKSSQKEYIKPRARGDLAGEITLDQIPVLAPTDTHQATGYTNNHAPLSALASITWASSDEDVATVDSDGLITAIEDGTTEITADGGGVVGRTTVTVFDGVPFAVVVTPDTSDVDLTTPVQLTAVVNNQFGNPIPGETVTWASDDELVATVDATGLVTGVEDGTATITATSDTDPLLNDTCAVTVLDIVPAAVVVTPPTAALTHPDTEQLTVAVNNQFGNPIPGETVTWDSDEVGFATVDAAGLVTTVAAGEATVTATSDTDPLLTDTCVVTVS